MFYTRVNNFGPSLVLQTDNKISIHSYLELNKTNRVLENVFTNK